MTRSHLAACAGVLAAGLVTLTAQQPPTPAPPATTQPPPASAPPATQQPPVMGPQPPATTPPQSQVFRGGVELVSLNVTAMDGARYIYSATTSPTAAKRAALKQYLGVFFKGSAGELVTALLRQERWTEAELERLRGEIDRIRRERQKP